MSCLPPMRDLSFHMVQSRCWCSDWRHELIQVAEPTAMNSPPCGKCESQCENVLDGPCYRLGHNKISGDLDLAIMNNPTCKSKQFQPESPQSRNSEELLFESVVLPA